MTEMVRNEKKSGVNITYKFSKSAQIFFFNMNTIFKGLVYKTYSNEYAKD